MLEATTMYEGTRLALEMNWQNVDIESDSQIVIKHIRRVKYHWRIATLGTYTLTPAKWLQETSWRVILRSTNNCVQTRLGVWHLTNWVYGPHSNYCVYFLYYNDNFESPWLTTTFVFRLINVMHRNEKQNIWYIVYPKLMTNQHTHRVTVRTASSPFHLFSWNSCHSTHFCIF